MIKNENASSSQEVKWNNLSDPYQPKGEAGLVGKVVSNPTSEEISGASIMPQTPDSQTIPSGNPGNS
ncbi:MAG: hypothetical protein CVU54_09705 [Deltaproteobacteria bacterium HGW-Deltaproteobacteria-12]|jgi:hypothetical protein|nr:MAG: hypothetical protein CVU54_09705 [Deltaproteobacteria bacterium HGW-Deltaproteobacteria-12]